MSRTGPSRAAGSPRAMPRARGCAYLGWMLLALVAAMPIGAPVRAGEGEVLHVGAATTLHLDGSGWVLDRSGSRKANLVAVQGNGASFVVRGLKMGQTKLVFRKGKKMFEAHIDVLR